MNPSTEKELDRVFSLYIRTLHSKDGVCICYTCGTPIRISNAQNGHCFGRSNRGVRFDERDCRPQCITCNYFDKSKDEYFKYKLLQEIGEKEYDNLYFKSKQMVKITDTEAKAMIKLYKEKLKAL